MTSSDVRQKVFAIISQVMEIPIEEVNDKSSSDTIENWDSMTQMSLTLALQEAFKVKLPSVQATKLSNVTLILSTLEDILKVK